MFKYEVITLGNLKTVKRSDGVYIPIDSGNSDYAEYLSSPEPNLPEVKETPETPEAE
jgi:hypothetical protein